MKNSLTQFPHIEFTREAVTKRAKETKSILGNLTLLGNHPDGEHRLYFDDATGEYWQYSSAWNWGAKPYCFLVPMISLDDWLTERYVDPDEMIVFVAVMQQFLAAPANRQIPNLQNHVRSLQRIGNMPQDPEGRWFEPYLRENVIPNLEQVGSSNGG